MPFEFPKDPEPVHLDQSIDITQDVNFSDSLQSITIKDSGLADQCESKMLSEMADDRAPSDHQFLNGNNSQYPSDTLAKSHSTQFQSLQVGSPVDPQCSWQNAEQEIIAK